MKREIGYYWVKDEENVWVVSEYEWNYNQTEMYWYFGESEDGVKDEFLLEINETRILNPDEVNPYKKALQDILSEANDPAIIEIVKPALRL